MLLFCNVSISQTFVDSIIVNSQIKTFQSYIKNSHYLQSGSYFFKENSISPKSNIELDSLKMIFLNSNQVYEHIKKDKISKLYELSIKNVNDDTLDVFITGWSVDYKKRFLKKGEFQFSRWCGGTNGNIPDGRMIFNKSSNSWTFFSLNELYDFELKESVPTREEK